MTKPKFKTHPSAMAAFRKALEEAMLKFAEPIVWPEDAKSGPQELKPKDAP